MKKIVKFLLPNRRDVPGILVCLLIINAIVIPELILQLKAFSSDPSSLSELLPIFFPILVLTVAIAACLGTFSRSQLNSSQRWIATIIFVWLLLGWLLYRESLLFETTMTNDRVFAGTLKIWWGQALLFLLTWSLSYGAHKRLVASSRNRTTGEDSFQRGLVIAAIFLFVITTLGRLIQGTDMIGLWAGIGNNWANLAILFLGCVVLLGVVPSQICELARGWRSLWLLLIYFAGYVATFPIIFGNESLNFTIPYFIVATGVFLGLKLYREQIDHLKPTGSQSIWPAIYGSLTVAMLSISLFYSLNTIRYWESNCFQIARQVKQLTTQPQVDCVAVANAIRDGIYAELRVNAGADPHCLESLRQLGSFNSLLLQNLTPQIETNYLLDSPISFCSITDSEITDQQISNLASGASYLAINNCRLVVTDKHRLKSPKATSRATPARFQICNLAAGETTNFLELIDPNNFTGTVAFNSPHEFSDRDWKHIIESSVHFPILLQFQVTPADVDQFVNYFETNKEKRLARFQRYQLSIYANGVSETDIIRMIMDTPVYPNFDYPIAEKSLQFPTDVLFATEGSGKLFSFLSEFENATTEQRPSWIDFIQSNRWSFDVRETNDAKGLFIPFVGDRFVDEISQMTDLEILSLETRWLPALRNYPVERVVNLDLKPWAKLTQLRRLELPYGFVTADLSFLKSMPNLQHLQIDLFGDGSTKPTIYFDAEYCPNLETLIVFGKPSSAVAKEIMKLPKLKKLTIRNSINFTGGGYSVKAPPEFQQHIERVRELIREKYLDQIESNDENSTRKEKLRSHE